MAEEMEDLARDLLPLASPLMDYIHRRFLQHFVEQDVVGHMEMELERRATRPRPRARRDRLRRPRRLHALHRGGGRGGGAVVVERFIEAVTDTLPDDARVVKTIGDEVMIVGQDVQRADGLGGRLPAPVHRSGPRRASASTTAPTLYRDGDYFGRDVNLASRVVARARGGEVLVTRLGGRRGARRASTSGSRTSAQVKLKGFDEPRAALPGVLPRTDDERPLEAARGERAHRARASRCWCCSRAARDSVCLLDVA